MRLSRARIILIIIGAFLIVMAPVWKWAIGPGFVKLPTDLDTSFNYNGTLKIYADPKTMTLLPPGQEHVTHLKITGTEKAVPSKSTADVVAFNEKVVISDADTGKLLPYGWEKNYAVDRKTSMSVSGYGSDLVRDDLTVTFPIGTEKRSYMLWDDDLHKSEEARFVRETTMDGVKHKDVNVYVFEVGGDQKEMRNPPYGIPSQITGAQVKKVLNDPNAPIPDDMKFPISCYKKNATTIVVEPRTGVKVGGDVHMEYSVNTSIIGSPDYRKLAVIDYGQTPQSVKTAIDSSARYFSLMDLNSTWMPLFTLVVGLIMVVVGLFGWRKQKAVPPPD